MHIVTISCIQLCAYELTVSSAVDGLEHVLVPANKGQCKLQMMTVEGVQRPPYKPTVPGAVDCPHLARDMGQHRISASLL